MERRIEKRAVCEEEGKDEKREGLEGRRIERSEEKRDVYEEEEEEEEERNIKKKRKMCSD